MKESVIFPDYLFEVSWEVCNKVGGIYAVLSTKAATLKAKLGDNLVFIGPDVWEGQESPFFREGTASPVLTDWAKIANKDGMKVRVGRWDVPGQPNVVLVDFRPYYSVKNAVYAQMWEWYGVNSMAAYGDYDEGCMFAYASALVIESLYKYQCPQRSNVVAQFNEWTTGMGVLYLKHQLPSIATVFTTHATCVGRSICGNNKPLYDYLPGYYGDQMADELNMTSKHSIEKGAAQQADCFTTVSEITATECNQLLERMPFVTPNGFESGFVPSGVTFSRVRRESRAALSRVVECMTGYVPQEDALFIGTAGRCEWKNKGLDVFLDTMNRLRTRVPNREIVAFIMVPGWVAEARGDLKTRLQSNVHYEAPLSDAVFTHAVHNYYDDVILKRIHELGFQNLKEDKVKVFYIPCYLNGDDGIFNRTYYNMLAGLDLTVYPSYYEPWGYTPMESCAFGVPTITTSLSGFGMWCKTIGRGKNIAEGVAVINRNDSNYESVVNEISDIILNCASLQTVDAKPARQEAKKIAAKASWKNFIKAYEDAYNEALSNTFKRINA
ncbi:MAG: glycogen/starch synthase [Bacteroidales bacterium]|nr:glycogen/starch synthase [Bacteroidales bacterium]